MSKVIIVGNGFDLAHGIKSSYHDFMLYLLKKGIVAASNSQKTQANENGPAYKVFEDELIKVKALKLSNLEQVLPPYLQIDDLIDLRNATKSGSVIVEIKSDVINDYFTNWSDFEESYFKCLMKIIEKNSSSKNSSVVKLNKEFTSLRTQLIEYIQQVQLSNGQVDFSTDGAKELLNLLKPEINNKSIIINFNYTNTAEQYVQKLGMGTSIQMVNIHGNLGKMKYEDEIVFGFDDDEDERFNNIILKEEQKCLEYFKSSLYMTSSSRQTLIGLLYQDYFNVICLGHSLSSSDATILREVFTHTKCRKIEIFYNPIIGLEDFNTKARQLRKMLYKTRKWTDVVSRDLSKPMPQPTLLK